MFGLQQWVAKYEVEYAKRMFGVSDIEELTDTQIEKLMYELELEHHFYLEDHI